MNFVPRCKSHKETDDRRFSLIEVPRDHRSPCKPHKPCDPCPPCPERKEKCCFGATLISAMNPTSVLPIPTAVPTLAIAAVVTSVDLTGWLSKLVIDVDGSFDQASGIYTVPESGDYKIDLVVNYSSNAPLTRSGFEDGTHVPFIKLYDVDTGLTIITASTFPYQHIEFTLPPQSSEDLPIIISETSILRYGQVIIDVTVSLVEGQRIRFNANSNGFERDAVAGLPPVNAVINFNPDNSDTTLSIIKIRNPPLVIVV